MPFDSSRHHRASQRLHDYDYSCPGSYFVTICSANRELLFGTVIINLNQGDGTGAQVELSEYGQIVQSTWLDLPNHNPGIELDAFVIMPDHIHGIIQINPTYPLPAPVPDESKLSKSETVSPVPESYGLSELIRQFKTFSSRRINALRQSSGQNVWQRNYHDHIIRDEDDRERILYYIAANPSRWAQGHRDE